MSVSQGISCRAAAPQDALTLSVLATQVFLDTYATQGVNHDLAKEASTLFSAAEFARRLQDPAVEITVATEGEYLVGFIDLAWATACPVESIAGVEVFRLYVQAPFQGQGVGRRLMNVAESRARERSSPHLWLTAWAENLRALAFYAALGFRDMGATTYVIEGKGYENRVLAKRIDVGVV